MYKTIKNLREKFDYSQTAVASYLKISRQMYVKYENGEVEPSVRVVKQLCSLYQVSYDFIINDELAGKTAEHNSEEYSFYHYKNESEALHIASSSPAYSIPRKNKGIGNVSAQRKETVDLTETVNLTVRLMEQIKNLKDYQQKAVSAFISYLMADEKKESNVGIESGKSKEAFFALAGKIDLDEEELMQFRESSLI
ncbi:MAG: helix-turn-helix domain-containing protein [Treponema sp.]|nr:helix-turn-helix domain-containing protein [Treponema sp.]